MNRLNLTLAASLLTLSTSIPTLHAQEVPAPNVTATMAPPMLPMLTSYSYWPVQFVQWVGTELPYSMIELDTDGSSKHPLLYVTLTERATGKRVHYTDNDGLLATARARGEEAHKTALAYEPADTEAVGSVSSVRFTAADGRPVQWRFVQGSEISEQGSGLTPLPEAKLPLFLYREGGAVAGEGTALQVGETVSTAAVWAEISHPPYFIAYRGAETQSAHTLAFLPGQETWTVVSSPATLTSGATWELEEAHGNHRSLRIDKTEGAHLTVTATDRFAPGTHCTLEVTRIGDHWRFEQARFAPVREGEKHFLAVQFVTSLATSADGAALTLVAGRKTIAQGKLTSRDAGPEGTQTLSFANPVWLNGKALTVQESLTANTVAITSKP